MIDTLKGVDRCRAQIGKPPANKRVCILVNARMASQRFPGKVILPLAGEPLWWHVMQRCEAQCRQAGIQPIGAAVITSKNVENDVLETQARAAGYDCIRYDPEWDVLGRRLAALDYYGCDLYMSGGADSPLAWWEHGALAWDVVMTQSYAILWTWKNNTRSGDPRRLVLSTVSGVGPGIRWQLELAKWLAQTEADHEADGLPYLRQPEWARLVPPPRGAYRDPMPDMWEWWRWYTLEVDSWEDGLTMQTLYDEFYKPSGGEVVDARKCIQYIDKHPEHHYSAHRVVSALNQYAMEMETKLTDERFSLYCERYLAPPGAQRYYCRICGEYLGYQDLDGRLYRPDGAVVQGEARLGCNQRHFMLWSQNLERMVSAGSAVMAEV